mgnify:CR=1 FL=1
MRRDPSVSRFFCLQNRWTPCVQFGYRGAGGDEQSPEEKQMIEERVKLSGMAKGEYFIQSCMHQKISVLGNVRTFDAIKESVSKLDRKLMELQSVEELDEVTLESLRMVLELLDGIYNKREEEN